MMNGNKEARQHGSAGGPGEDVLEIISPPFYHRRKQK